MKIENYALSIGDFALRLTAVVELVETPPTIIVASTSSATVSLCIVHYELCIIKIAHFALSITHFSIVHYALEIVHYFPYLCHIMDEKATMPYPERTEDIILLVCEPAAEYGKPIVYQGTTITNALKDYYSFTTNREKVDVLK